MEKYLQTLQKKQETYRSKVEEYSKMTLDELKEVYNGPKRIGGTYRRALLDVVNQKLFEEKQKTVEEGIKELKEENNDTKVDN